MVCRFYSYTLEQVRDLTIQEFKVLSENMIEITKMENPTEGSGQGSGQGSSEPMPLSSANIPKKRKK